jgi:hypothetical protein
MKADSHDAFISHTTELRRCVNGKNLGFDNYRLTISVSVTGSARSVTPPASLVRFPCKLDLMPAHYGLCNELRQG